MGFKVITTCLMLSLLLLPFKVSSAQEHQAPDTSSFDAQKADLRQQSLNRRFFSKQGLAAKPDEDSPSNHRFQGGTSGRVPPIERRAHAGVEYRSAVNQAGAAGAPGIQLRDALPAGNTPTAVVAGDFNKDGHPDFVIANGMTDDLWIYPGKGDGTFALPRIIPLTKGLSPVYLQTADLRRNGTLDLIVAESDSSTIGVLLGNGDGTFGYEQVFTLPQPPAALVVDDFNHDGKLDIACAMRTVSMESNGVSFLAMLPGDGNGNFGTPVFTHLNSYSRAWNLASGDVNGDGKPDLLISGPGLENTTIFINAGDGTFTKGQTLLESNAGVNTAGLDAKLADIDGNGCLDAVVADLNSYVRLYKGDCGGHFSTGPIVRMPDGNSALQMADMNGDGHLDIVTTALWLSDGINDDGGNTMSIAFGDGHGNFTTGRSYVGTGEGYSLAIADFNNDGKQDVVKSNTYTDTATLYINDGSGGFGFPQGLFIGSPAWPTPWAIASSPSFSDVNGDHKDDVVLLENRHIAALLNDGTGRFTGPVVSDLGISDSVFLGDYRLGDFRGTGKLDLVCVGQSKAYSGGSDFILFSAGNGDGSFGRGVWTYPAGAQGSIATGDFNRDGKLDFVAVGATSGMTGKKLTPFLGNGDGTFRQGSIVSFTGGADVTRVFAVDVNQDGALDVLVHDTGNGYWTTESHLWVFLGNGDGSFQPARQLFSPFQPIAIADVNGDKLPDVVQYDFMWPDGMTTTDGPARFTTYLGQSSGLFNQSSTYAPYSGTPLKVQPYLQFGDPAATSIVGDLNGDGKPDAIAFQAVEPVSHSTYAQVLMGNGDGTFTPTYNVYPFFKDLTYPKYAHDLDGDGRMDLLEFDQLTSSIQVFKGSRASALQIRMEDERITGNSSCGWVFPNVTDASDRVVNLSSSIPGVTLPGSIPLPAGSLSQKFCFSLENSLDWQQVFDVRAQLGTDVAVAYASKRYTVGFSQDISPDAEQVLRPGESTQPVTITLSSVEGYSSTVQLHCEGLPAGASCTFGVETLTLSPGGSASTTVVVHTTTSTRSHGAIVIVAEDGNVVKRSSFVLSVEPLFIYEKEVTIRVTPSRSSTASLTLLGIPPYSVACSGLPAGIDCAVSGTQNPYPSSTSLDLSVTVPADFEPGSYPFTVIVSAGPESRSLPGHLEIGAIAVQPPSALYDWASPGGTVKTFMNIDAVNVFAGTVNLSCAVDLAGGTCTGSDFTVVSQTQAYVIITVPAGTPIGRYNLTVTATAAGFVRSYVFPFYVADFTGTMNPASLSLSHGGNGSITATISATTGFAGTVSMDCTAPWGLTCTASPISANPQQGSPATVKLNISANSFAFTRPARNSRLPWLLAAALFPLGLTIVRSRPECSRITITLIGVILLAPIGFLSCGGGGGGGTQPGTPQVGGNSYTVTLKGTAGGVIKTLGNATITVAR